MPCSCESHHCEPGCACGLTGPYDRFAVTRITNYSPDCLQHGYMFLVDVASLLRYGD
jgi:hypothetical protein